MARKPEEKLVEEFTFYTDAGSWKALKNKRVRFLKPGGGGQTKANTNIPIWDAGDEGFDEKDYKPIVVKVYTLEHAKISGSNSRPIEYLYLLGLIGAIVVGYFVMAVL
jgi:hypothetical protein